MARSPFPSRASAVLFAAVLLALGPAAAAVTSALCAPAATPCEQMGHSMPADAPADVPADGMSCCVDAPAAEDAVVPAPPSPSGDAPTVAVRVPVLPLRHVDEAPRRDTGPPGRLHLALSVLQV